MSSVLADDPYTAGFAQGFADHQAGCEYAPEEDDQEYLDGYEEGWDDYDDKSDDGED